MEDGKPPLTIALSSSFCRVFSAVNIIDVSRGTFEISNEREALSGKEPTLLSRPRTLRKWIIEEIETI